MKTHKDFLKDNAAEKYVLGTLSGKDKALFEEHMLFCDVCGEEVRQLTISIGLLEESVLIPDIDASIPESNRNENATKIRFYLKIAAGITILAVLSWFAIWYFGGNNGRNEPVVAVKKEKKKIEKVAPIKTDTVQAKNLVAENIQNDQFIENPRYERIIKEEFRSNDFEVESPPLSTIFKVGETIVFSWKGGKAEEHSIELMNNKGKILLEQKTNSPYILTDKFKPGLYYWQLENSLETIYVGKFIIK